MSKYTTSVGKGAAVGASEDAANISTSAGKNQSVTATTHTIAVSDQGEVIEYSNASAIAVTLPTISTVSGSNIHTDDFTVTLKNIGAGVVTVTRGGTDTFDDATTSKTLAQYEFMTIQTGNSLTKWNVINKDSYDKVKKSGDTMTGNLRVNDGYVKVVDTASGIEGYIDAYNAGNRFRAVLSGGALNAGAGSEVFSLSNATGVGTFVYGAKSSVAPTNSSDLTRLDFIESGTSTLSNKTLTSPVIDTGVSGTAVDTDGTLAADSDTLLASQKAIKTYVDKIVVNPAFRAYRTVDYTAGTGAVVAFDAETFDKTSDYSTSTYRFTPSKAGLYYIKANIAIRSHVSAPAFGDMFIYKNGSIYAGSGEWNNTVGDDASYVISSLVDMNGTTDYLDVRTSTADDIGGGASYTWFEGFMFQPL